MISSIVIVIFLCGLIPAAQKSHLQCLKSYLCVVIRMTASQICPNLQDLLPFL